MNKTIRKAIIILPCLAVIFVVFVFMNHKIRLNLEAGKYPPIGDLVEVNGHKMHVYQEGEGSDTLVFLAGWSTSSPVWDFKGLYSQLSDQYRIVVIERSGYGYSETSGSSREIDMVLEESRLALASIGETGPFILVPHSVAGLEALYWAQMYPDEVKAIIGLDISFPETYESYDEALFYAAMAKQSRDAAIKNFGFIRFMPALFDDHEPIIFGLLNETEIESYKAAVYRSYYTRDMFNEAYKILLNAQKVASEKAPADTPMLLFIATEQGQAHLDLSLRYLSQIENKEYYVLEGGHYIHDFKPDEISADIKAFISLLSMQPG